MSENKKNIFKIYYDKKCPLCSTYAKTVSKRDKDQLFFDANDTPNNQNILKEELLETIHLIETDRTVRTGADAMMTSLSKTYPILRPLSHLIRLPILKNIANFIYNLISKRRNFFTLDIKSRLFWIFIVTNFGLLLSILLSLPAWSDKRTFPLTPIVNNIDQFNILTPMLVVGLFISLILSLFKTKNYNLYSSLTLIFLLFLVSLDINRLQPWVFHYGGILFLFSWFLNQSKTRSIQIIDATRLIVIGIYFWSGVQKINTAFVLEVFPWFTEPIWSPFGNAGAGIILILGIFIPFIEAAFAIGLLTHRFRKISIIGSGGMLIIVTLSLILGHGWNSVVWPWNFAIFSMALILFYRYDSTLPEFFARLKINALALLATGIFIIMPVGNYFGLVDHYLSWSLYSGHVPTASISATSKTISILSPTSELKNSNTLPILTWTMDTMNLVPYPEERVFFNVFNSICQKHDDPSLLLIITTRPIFESTKTTKTTYNCSSNEVLSVE